MGMSRGGRGRPKFSLDEGNSGEPIRDIDRPLFVRNTIGVSKRFVPDRGHPVSWRRAGRHRPGVTRTREAGPVCCFVCCGPPGRRDMPSSCARQLFNFHLTTPSCVGHVWFAGRPWARLRGRGGAFRVSPSRRTVTPRASIVTEPTGPRSGNGVSSTSSVANAGSGSAAATASGSGPADDGRTSLPWRARLRQADNCLRDTP